MPVSWLTLLRAVPWGEVIDNAPKLAEGAKRLWRSIKAPRSLEERPDQAAQSAPANEIQRMAVLEEQVSALEAQVSELQGEMRASAELIKSLADQNAQLVKEIETLRVRVVLLTAAIAITAAVAVTTLCFAWPR